MASPTQVATSSRKMKEADDRLRMPMRAVVNRALPDLDAVQCEFALSPGITRLRAKHPYVGPNSWIRVMPESGTMLLTSQRGDDVMAEIFGYHVPQPHIRIRQYKDGQILYRPLDAGELEIMSTGRAYAFFGSRGDVELRGGTIRHDLSQSNLEIKSIAPTFKRRLHKASPSTLAHEERFGVVKRPDLQKPNLIQNYIRQLDQKFSMEYSRWLNTTDNLPLVDLQEGHVVDGMGQFVKQSSTSKTLRSRRRWYHKQAGFISFEVDEELNVFFANTTQAKETKAVLGAKNVFTLTAQDIKLIITKTGTFQFGNSYALRTKTVSIDAPTSYTLKTAKARINSTDVGFGPSPVFPIALAGPTTASMSTAFSALQGFVTSLSTILAVDYPAVVPPATATSAALGQAQASLSQVPSAQVKASG